MAADPASLDLLGTSERLVPPSVLRDGGVRSTLLAAINCKHSTAGDQPSSWSLITTMPAMLSGISDAKRSSLKSPEAISRT